MLLLPTCGRPRELADLITAFHACGETAEVCVMIDDALNERREDYSEIRWPKGWTYIEYSEHHELTKLLNMGVKMHPRAPCWGFFGDHFRPLTPFASQLAIAAGEWFIAWPCDGDSSYRQPAGAPHFGRKLVEALGGWIMLPTTFHCATDRVWWMLHRDLGIVRHVESVRFTRTWPLGQGAVPRVFKGQDVNAHDFKAWKAWERDEAPGTIARIREAMTRDGFTFGADGRIDARHGCSPFKEGW